MKQKITVKKTVFALFAAGIVGVSSWAASGGVATAQQTKLTYIRGDYKMEFVFNGSTDLDHINLLKK
ncbi:hypothetical protein [Paenibacillus macerans]|uniref:hypothetical protein n=1 Tax=Paenibacillus macerans TaxID=44252 RepID=UPI003D30F3D8